MRDLAAAAEGTPDELGVIGQLIISHVSKVILSCRSGHRLPRVSMYSWSTTGHAGLGPEGGCRWLSS